MANLGRETNQYTLTRGGEQSWPFKRSSVPWSTDEWWNLLTGPGGEQRTQAHEQIKQWAWNQFFLPMLGQRLQQQQALWGPTGSITEYFEHPEKFEQGAAEQARGILRSQVAEQLRKSGTSARSLEGASFTGQIMGKGATDIARLQNELRTGRLSNLMSLYATTAQLAPMTALREMVYYDPDKKTWRISWPGEGMI